MRREEGGRDAESSFLLLDKQTIVWSRIGRPLSVRADRVVFFCSGNVKLGEQPREMDEGDVGVLLLYGLNSMHFAKQPKFQILISFFGMSHSISFATSHRTAPIVEVDEEEVEDEDEYTYEEEEEEEGEELEMEEIEEQPAEQQQIESEEEEEWMRWERGGRQRVGWNNSISLWGAL